MATFNVTVFRKELLDAANTQSFIDAAFNIAEPQFNEQKQKEIIDKFDNHAITSELRPGLAPGSSEFVSRGTLYGFIGFEDESPTDELRNVLVNDIKIQKKSLGAKYRNNFIEYQFPVSYPTEVELHQVTPTPWGTMRSWLVAIERGLSNFNQYLGIRFGRSGEGIQKPNIDLSGSFRPPKDGYVLKWVRDFINKFKNR